jgi:hypothetical protein
LGCYLALTLASAPFEIVLIARGRHRRASYVYAVSGIARAVFMMAPVVVWPRLEALLAESIAFAALRFAVMMFYLRREFGPELRPDIGRLREQVIKLLGQRRTTRRFCSATC